MAVVVRDLGASLDHYARLLPGRTRRCWTFTAAQPTTVEYRGGSTTFTARLALDDRSPQLELIEPLDGDSIHRDWLVEHGGGLHHVGVVVESVAEVVVQMTSAAYPVIQA